MPMSKPWPFLWAFLFKSLLPAWSAGGSAVACIHVFPGRPQEGGTSAGFPGRAGGSARFPFLLLPSLRTEADLCALHRLAFRCEDCVDSSLP